MSKEYNQSENGLSYKLVSWPLFAPTALWVRVTATEMRTMAAACHPVVKWTVNENATETSTERETETGIGIGKETGTGTERGTETEAESERETGRGTEMDLSDASVRHMSFMWVKDTWFTRLHATFRVGFLPWEERSEKGQHCVRVWLRPHWRHSALCLLSAWKHHRSRHGQPTQVKSHSATAP